MVQKKQGSKLRKKGGKKRAAGTTKGKVDFADDVTGETELSNEDPGGQLRVPGAERKVNKKIEPLAVKVLELQTQRAEILEQEVEARAELTEIMKKLDIPEYDLGNDYIAELQHTGELKAMVHKKKKVKANE